MVITTILIPGTVSPKLMDGFVAQMKIVIGLTLTWVVMIENSIITTYMYDFVLNSFAIN